MSRYKNNKEMLMLIVFYVMKIWKTIDFEE